MTKEANTGTLLWANCSNPRHGDRQRQRERERERETERDRQSQTDRQTERQRERDTHTHTLRDRQPMKLEPRGCMAQELCSLPTRQHSCFFACDLSVWELLPLQASTQGAALLQRGLRSTALRMQGAGLSLEGFGLQVYS